MARYQKGEINATTSLVLTLAADGNGSIRWMAGTDGGLLIGTAGGEYILREATSNDVLSADNVTVRPVARWGSASVPPIELDDAVIFVERGGRAVLEAAYSLERDGYAVSDLTVLAGHVTEPRVVQMAFQRKPFRVVWCVLSDGTLAGCTHDRSQNVYAWHRHAIAGTEARVESIAVIPGTDGRDELWLAVSRNIPARGTGRSWTVERLAHPVTGVAASAARQLDSFLVYSGTPATTITGLRHIRGETGRALADGVPIAAATVANVGGDGQFTVPAASKVCVGLPYTCELETLSLDVGAADGTSQGKTRRPTRLTLRVEASAWGEIGKRGGPWTRLRYRDPGASEPLVPDLFTGDIRSAWPGGYDRDCRLMVRQLDPVPLTVLGMMPQLDTQDGA
jgi:hypothetical protein